MLYGTETHKSYQSDGSADITIKRYRGGKVVHEIVGKSESVQTKVKAEVATVLLGSLELFSTQHTDKLTLEVFWDRDKNSFSRVVKTYEVEKL